MIFRNAKLRITGKAEKQFIELVSLGTHVAGITDVPNCYGESGVRVYAFGKKTESVMIDLTIAEAMDLIHNLQQSVRMAKERAVVLDDCSHL